MAVLYEDKYYSSDGGVWRVLKQKGGYAIVEGYKKEKRVIMLVEGLTYEGTQIRWLRQAQYPTLDAAERDLKLRTAALARTAENKKTLTKARKTL